MFIWIWIGLSEIRRREEEQRTLKSGYTFPYIGHTDTSEGGVRFIIYRKQKPHIIGSKSISTSDLSRTKLKHKI